MVGLLATGSERLFPRAPTHQPTFLTLLLPALARLASKERAGAKEANKRQRVPGASPDGCSIQDRNWLGGTQDHPMMIRGCTCTVD